MKTKLSDFLSLTETAWRHQALPQNSLYYKAVDWPVLESAGTGCENRIQGFAYSINI